MHRLLPIIMLLLLQCSSPPKPAADSPGSLAMGDNSRNSLDWAGTYRDTLPAADGPGILTTLTLRNDQSYTLTTRFLEEDDAGQTKEGEFEWWPDGGTIRLMGLDGQQTPSYFQVAEGKVYQLDLEGRRVRGPLEENYALPKVNDELTDMEWRLTELRGDAVAMQRGDVPTLMLRSHGSLATGTGGCNSFRGNFQLDGERLSFTPLAATKMACPALSTETAYFEALGEVTGYRIEGDHLLLLGEGENTLLRFTAS